MAAEKDTIYIDIDDEITSIIEKVKKSDSDIVALVLPKRAAVLQSIVNMKLLKKSADGSGKRAVLITSEAGLLPLAGAVGLYVAKNLQSKPEIPSAPDMGEPDDEEIEAELDDPEIDPTLPVAALAAGKAASKDDEIPTVDEPDPAPVAAEKAAKAKKSKAKKDKSKKVPNFEKFRLKVFLIVAAVIVLIFGWYWATFMAPRLTAVIVTDSTTTNPTIAFTADPNATKVNLNSKTVQAKVAEKTDSDEQTAAATGTKDVGTKATGTVSMTATKCSGNPFDPPSDVSAGTTISQNGNSYTTTADVSFTGTGASGGCFNYSGNSTGIKAKNNGTDANVSSATFSVSGRSDVSASGSASGGTSKTVKVVTQQDVDTAKGKIDDNGDKVKQELASELNEEGYVVIEDSFTKKDDTTVSPEVGQEADDVTVRVERTYSMWAVKQDQLNQLVEDAVKPELESSNQQMQDDGIANASYEVVKQSGDEVELTMNTTVQIGPKVDEESLKTEIAGQKRGDTENIIKNISGVKDVELNYSPFWVSRTPKNTSKIIIEYKKAGE